MLVFDITRTMIFKICTVESLLLAINVFLKSKFQKSSLGGKYFYTPSEVIASKIKEVGEGIDLIGTTIVGFTPEEAESLTFRALREGIPEMWKLRKYLHQM